MRTSQHQADSDLKFMQRAAYLASTSGVETSPNPKVGAVIVRDGVIVAEGLHRRDGGPHAEVEALSRAPEGAHDMRGATVYSSLEPCSITGRTPPCADRLVAERFGRAVVGAIDFTPNVCGEGLRRLRLGGLTVDFGIGQPVCYALARPRNVFATEGRPYVTLKQAVSADGYVGRDGLRVGISGPMANVLTHQWRSEHDAILVGSRTFSVDRPALTTRAVCGPSPAVVIYDPSGRLSPEQVAEHFSVAPPRTVYYASYGSSDRVLAAVRHVPLRRGEEIRSLLEQLHGDRIGRLLVEGGPATLSKFVSSGHWDEYREWRSVRKLSPGQGPAVAALSAPGVWRESIAVDADILHTHDRVG